jgi:hypothetical protein
LDTKEINFKFFLKKTLFYICNYHDDNPWKIHILMMVRTEREQKVERQQKESGKKGGQKLEGLYVGEGFVLSTFSILGPHLPDFGTPPLGLTGSGGPSNPEGTRHKTFSYVLIMSCIYSPKSHQLFLPTYPPTYLQDLLSPK